MLQGKAVLVGECGRNSVARRRHSGIPTQHRERPLPEEPPDRECVFVKVSCRDGGDTGAYSAIAMQFWPSGFTHTDGSSLA